MSRVFISYKRVDAARANIVRQRLDALGVPLFIDAQMNAGEDFISVINQQLEAAAAVLVLWTEQSIKTDERNFVISEAMHGLNRRILVAAALDMHVHQKLPVPFTTTQTADLSEWIAAPAADHREWQSVLDGLGRILNRPGLGRLASAMENGSEQAKRDFVRDYPQDPFANRFVDEIATIMRKDFDDQMRKARERIVLQNEQAEDSLHNCERDFETRMGSLRAELQAGRELWPPDPAAINDDSVPALRTQIRINKDRAEKAEESLAAALAQKPPSRRLSRSINVAAVLVALLLGGALAPLIRPPADSQEIETRERKVVVREKAVEDQLATLAGREQALNGREEAFNQRLAEDQKSKAFAEAVARCDELTSYYFDPDVPLGAKWVVNHTDIAIGPATAACEQAQKMLTEHASHPEAQRIKRRLMLQVGRIYAGQGSVAAYNSDTQMADRLFDTALSHFRSAAESGSSQAFTVIGSYYSGAFVMGTDRTGRYEPPKTPDVKLAWDNYFRAATMGNPLGLINTALVLMGIDSRFGGVVPLDQKLGQELLEGARRLDHRRAYYEMGFAIYRGRGGYEPKPEEGRKLIGQAFCKQEPKAIDFFNNNSLYPKPTCS
jgi:hypothetical protein